MDDLREVINMTAYLHMCNTMLWKENHKEIFLRWVQN